MTTTRSLEGGRKQTGQVHAGPEEEPGDVIGEDRSHGVELRRCLGGLDLHLSHLELGALQPLAQGGGQGSGSLALQTLVVHSVLDGLQT